MSNFKTIYFPIDKAIQIHDDMVIGISGGRSGTQDVGRLESVLFHLQNDDYYPTFEKKLTHLVFATSMFHMFNDGNKRSSLAFGSYFLKLNGFDYLADYFIQEMENIVLWLAMHLIDYSLFEEIITSIIIFDEITEDIKLKIALSIEQNSNKLQ
ncbi:Fic family protein [Streptococcus sp. 121]|uniref:Fic family protein n=1 Tax=Streptococcus sp. 121 TaxID=2797637 RepID=UPI0018F08B38|nr:Fic family protein [Streptococcus sp. 121]MBJ6746431.1 Fic family protein [Streptococcus sp. 121]